MDQEGDLDDLVNLLFDIKPLPYKSISIKDSFQNTKELFEALLMIFTNGMKKLYGNQGKVNLNSLTSGQFQDVYQRFLSIGIEVKYKVFSSLQIEQFQLQGETPLGLSSSMLVKYKDVNSNSIEDYFFQLQCEPNIYIIYFNLS